MFHSLNRADFLDCHAHSHLAMLHSPILGNWVTNGATLLLNLLHRQVVVGKFPEFLHQGSVSTLQLGRQEFLHVQGLHRFIGLRLWIQSGGKDTFNAQYNNSCVFGTSCVGEVRRYFLFTLGWEKWIIFPLSLGSPKHTVVLSHQCFFHFLHEQEIVPATNTQTFSQFYLLSTYF